MDPVVFESQTHIAPGIEPRNIRSLPSSWMQLCPRPHRVMDPSKGGRSHVYIDKRAKTATRGSGSGDQQSDCIPTGLPQSNDGDSLHRASHIVQGAGKW